MKTEITKITLDTMMGIREGVGECRMAEFRHYVNNLVKAKEGDLDVNTIPFPMLTDRVKQGIEASLAKRTNIGIEGGAIWTIVSLGGEYGNEKSQGIRVKVDMEFQSAGAPNFQRLAEFSVEELKELMKVVQPEAVEA